MGTVKRRCDLRVLAWGEKGGWQWVLARGAAPEAGAILGRGEASRAARVVAAVLRPRSSRAPSEPGRAGTALPGRQATDPAGRAPDPGIQRWVCRQPG